MSGTWWIRLAIGAVFLIVCATYGSIAMTQLNDHHHDKNDDNIIAKTFPVLSDEKFFFQADILQASSIAAEKLPFYLTGLALATTFLAVILTFLPPVNHGCLPLRLVVVLVAYAVSLLLLIGVRHFAQSSFNYEADVSKNDTIVAAWNSACSQRPKDVLTVMEKTRCVGWSSVCGMSELVAKSSTSPVALAANVEFQLSPTTTATNKNYYATALCPTNATQTVSTMLQSASSSSSPVDSTKTCQHVLLSHWSSTVSKLSTFFLICSILCGLCVGASLVGGILMRVLSNGGGGDSTQDDESLATWINDGDDATYGGGGGSSGCCCSALKCCVCCSCCDSRYIPCMIVLGILDVALFLGLALVCTAFFPLDHHDSPTFIEPFFGLNAFSAPVQVASASSSFSATFEAKPMPSAVGSQLKVEWAFLNGGNFRPPTASDFKSGSLIEKRTIPSASQKDGLVGSVRATSPYASYSFTARNITTSSYALKATTFQTGADPSSSSTTPFARDWTLSYCQDGSLSLSFNPSAVTDPQERDKMGKMTKTELLSYLQTTRKSLPKTGFVMVGALPTSWFQQYANAVNTGSTASLFVIETCMTLQHQVQSVDVILYSRPSWEKPNLDNIAATIKYKPAALGDVFSHSNIDIQHVGPMLTVGPEVSGISSSDNLLMTSLKEEGQQPQQEGKEEEEGALGTVRTPGLEDAFFSSAKKSQSVEFRDGRLYGTTKITTKGTLGKLWQSMTVSVGIPLSFRFFGGPMQMKAGIVGGLTYEQGIEMRVQAKIKLDGSHVFVKPTPLAGCDKRFCGFFIGPVPFRIVPQVTVTGNVTLQALFGWSWQASAQLYANGALHAEYSSATGFKTSHNFDYGMTPKWDKAPTTEKCGLSLTASLPITLNVNINKFFNVGLVGAPLINADIKKQTTTKCHAKTALLSVGAQAGAIGSVDRWFLSPWTFSYDIYKRTWPVKAWCFGTTPCQDMYTCSNKTFKCVRDDANGLATKDECSSGCPGFIDTAYQNSKCDKHEIAYIKSRPSGHCQVATMVFQIGIFKKIIRTETLGSIRYTLQGPPTNKKIRLQYYQGKQNTKCQAGLVGTFDLDLDKCIQLPNWPGKKGVWSDPIHRFEFGVNFLPSWVPSSLLSVNGGGLSTNSTRSGGNDEHVHRFIVEE